MNHIYIGVNCKKCRKPIATEKITPQQRDAQQGRVFKERELTCLIGHRDRYVSEDFHIFESSIALPVSSLQGEAAVPSGDLSAGRLPKRPLRAPDPDSDPTLCPIMFGARAPR